MNRQYIKDLPKGQYRDCTKEEIDTALKKANQVNTLQTQIAALKNEVDDIIKDCDHVYYDEAGFPYNIRICVVCGHSYLH